MSSSPNLEAVQTQTPRPSPTRRGRQSPQQFGPSPTHPPQQPGSQRTSSAAFYGMLRKTKRKTYGALYRGRRRAARTEDGEGSSSDSSTGSEGLNISYNGRNSRGVQAVGRSPFTAMPAGVPPAPSFYFSPQNTWDDGGGGQHYGARNAPSCGSGLPQNEQPQFVYDVDAMKKVVCGVERTLRQVVICCAMFIAGTIVPERAPTAQHALELSLVAWGTCVFIVIVGWWQSHRMERRARQAELQQRGRVGMQPIQPQSTPIANNLTGPSTRETEGIGRLEGTTISTINRRDVFQGMSRLSPTEPLSGQTAEEAGRKRPLDDEAAVDVAPPSPKLRRGMQRPIMVPTKHPRQHPQLENLFVMMVGKQERVFPNSAIYDIDNELFAGRMLLMFRTPDVDEPPSNDNDDPVANYFRGKQRRFEFQWQFKLKTLPPGDVFMGAELEEPIHMGMIQRALATTALKFVQKMNQGFTYFLSDSYESGRSYLSFPVGTSMDRFRATKPGEALPVLGQEIIEDPEQLKQRKKGAKIEWNTEDVYSMSLWSAYFDWIEWQIQGFPGIRPFSATSVAGVQPIIMTLYTTPFESTEKAPRRDIVFAIEVSNGAKSILGSEAREWNDNLIDDADMGEEVPRVRVLGERMETIESSDIDSIIGNESAEDEEMDEEFEPDPEDLEEDDDSIETDDDAFDDVETTCYLLSGSSISLREATGSYVASGGGYAVLQSSPTASLVLEKIQAKKKKRGTTHGPTTMVRNGDVVRVKLVDATLMTVKYLSLHRGWWFRWSSARPRRSGSFYVRTNEPNGSLVVLGCPFSLVSRRWSHYLIGACIESSAKYGGRMLGLHKAGKNSLLDEVGDEEEDDLPMQDNDLDAKDRDKRMMPLLLCAEAYHSSGGADLPSPIKSPARPSKLSLDDSIAIPTLGTPGAEMAQKSYEVDVPAMVEMMDRAQRTKQLVYAVRVKETVAQYTEPALEDSEVESTIDGEKKQSSASTSRTFVRLRTGRELAPILRLGVEYKPETSPSSDQWQQRFDFANQPELDDADSFTSSSDDSDSDDEMEGEDGDVEQLHSFLIAGPNHSHSDVDEALEETFLSEQMDFAKVYPDDHQEAAFPRTPSQHDLSIGSAADQVVGAGEAETPSRKERVSVKRSSLKKLKREHSTDSGAEDYSRQGSNLSESRRGGLPRVNSRQGALNQLENDILPVGSEAKKKSKGKHSAVIGRVAKTVKASTVITGKHVKNLGKGTVKGTVNAGRVAGRAIPVSSVAYMKQPRKHEPGGRVHRKRSDKRQMKTIGRAIKNIEGQFSPSLLTGQLLPQDLNCRKVSQILSRLSNAPNSSIPVVDAIASLSTSTSGQDLAFLRGSSAELGVKPLKTPDPTVDVECVVARCAYDGRWIEELCVLYPKESHLALYAPLAKKPSLVVSFAEVISARKCDEDESCPLPGFPVLAIDTPWKCHYLAFLDRSERDIFLTRLNEALFHESNEERPSQSRKVAQEYEGFMLSLEASLTGGTTGKYRPVSISKKSKHKRRRRILNGRRMPFDLASVADEETVSKGDAQERATEYVENLLTMALSFSPDALDATNSRFIEFLDETSRLRTLPLQEIDLSSKEAFCMLVNVYHCLLQHSLLLAVDGLPNKRSVAHFKRCSCYEIGGDVFSLAELECCLIRGKTSRPFHIKPPFVDAAKKSRPYRMLYSLGATDHRINFILNNGDLAYPSAVPVLRPNIMEDQMYLSASYLLADQVKIDERKRTVFLPKVCDVYRNDFGMGDGLVCLSQCLIYLEERDQLAIAAMLEDGVVSVKFQPNCNDFRPSLTELR